MPKFSFKTIEQMLLKCVTGGGGEPELGFRLRGKKYMIAYADRCSFQRCADETGANASGERYFATALHRAADRRTLAKVVLE